MIPAARVVAVGPDRVPLLEAGRGRPVLLVHGAAGDGRVWSPVLAHLPRGLRALAPTLRWCGPGPWRRDGPPFGTRTHAADLAALIEALGLGPLPVVGWSTGADVALRLLGNRPDLVARALLYDPGAPGLVQDPVRAARVGADAAAAFGPVVSAAETGDLAAAVARLHDAGGGPGAWDALPAARRDQALDSAPTIPRLLAAGPGDVPLGALDRNRVPLRVLWGARSRPVWVLPSRAAARLPGAEGGAVAGADHLWPLREPAAFARRTALWLDGAPLEPDAWEEA